jgi:ATP-dependent Lon protease
VGGIKEKLLAAHRAGVTSVILPRLNERDLHEVPEAVKQSLHIHFASTLDEVLALAFETPPRKLIKAGRRNTKSRNAGRPAKWLS